ncbi:serine/arginine repetitive matrix protein 2-like isoform X4 [Ostrea edulis]|uniref:serine/arginine repetitive matrix protein 2-like isoform X4 n=1 Tax=Ostrea edulis TaxID=37623 RepID=UPI0024AFD5B5|nr:serine/arginine repetitive matrix protein 2-like isoform X4 [Ostrea edulis]
MQNSVLWKKLYHNPSQYVKPREATVLSARMPREVTPEDYRLEKGAKTDRPPVATQFPSRYGYLPEINSPRPPDKSLVPVNGRKASPAGFNPNYDLDADERIRQLEVRLNVAEKSNRALLEEVLRLQGDVKTTNRRNEEVLREEKGSRHNLESAMKINNELITQLSARIKDAEEKLSEEKTALSSLVNHTKGVEQAVKSSQNELIAKKDVQSQKLIEMRAEIEELQGTKNQLERICFSMADDIRTLKMKMDQQSSELGTVSSELKNKSKKLEDDNRNQLEALRKTSNVQSQSDQQTTQLRGQVETRLSELRDVLVDVRAKQESEINERRTLEQQMSKKIYELQQSLSEANRRRDEGMHSMDILLREKDHASQADKLNLTSKVADTVEDVNKKLLSKEIKIREEMQERYLQLERLIHQEQQTRRESERAMREDTERKFLTLKHTIEELNLDVKEQFKNEKVKTKDTISKLDESISIVEKQSAENRKQFEKVMGAEISQRKMHEASTVEKLASVNEKLQIATSSLQQSIGGITQAMSSQNEKLKREVRGLVMEQKEASTRAMTDLDARMGYMKTRMNDFEEKLEARVATSRTNSPEATAVLSQNLREKVDAISLWQDTTQQTIKQLSTSVTKLPEDLYALQEKQSLMKTDMDSRFNAESDARTKESEILKAEIQNLKQRHDPLPATKSDLDNIAAAASADPQVQGSVRKLADSIQTVKTVLGMKIQSEQKLRQEDVQKLQDEIAILRTALEPLVKKPLGKNFVKGRGNSEEVNKWNVANAYSRPIPNLDRGVTRDSGLEEDASEESENSEDSGRGIFSKLIKPTQKKNFDSSDSGEPVPKRQAPKKKRIKPTQKKNFDSSDSEPVSKKQAPKKKTKAKQKKKSETEESDDDEEDSTDESKRGHKSRSLSRRKRSRTRSKRRSKSRRRSSRRDRSRSYDRRYSRSPSRRRSRSRYRTPSRSRGRSRRRHKSRSRDRSRTRSRRRTPRRSYSRGRSRKPRRSRDRSRSHGRRRDRSRTPYSDRSRGRSRGRSRSRTPKRYRDKRTRRSRSRSPKRSRGRGRSRRRSLSESPRRRRSRKRSPSRKKTSRDEPKDRKKRKEGDPWKKDDYDKKQRKKRDEEKEKRMPTESEPDSEDDVERRKKARARRH